ncbi:hypothetical protein [Paenibacillus macquariensis]|uniref:Four helix bundle protein n=1 Tax=Paenibacillus macquariensis TaxID=948756 RepID=A0ABY1JKY0_9BACL|nr:hypothetical protein [Paenibacillus macquariensis]MEC0090040.1 hypothetical protein [Paenibacillus macquariensis]OAB31078.1 hypothetical protein PMSM_20350 [Paenibacillus macquariensis subsp. macquariensis]SIQ36580.1 hypothetical protein SAMN05421578_101425 [Paenibacillus macquariensis]
MSKKLEGNGLWESSRMMLPQHKEQSLALSIHNDTSPKPQEPLTRKEMDMMREYILLPVALHIVEKKILEVEMSPQMLKLLYSTAAKVLANHIREDIQKSKKVLFERSIRVFEDSKSDSELTYRYICRGMEDQFVMTKDYMRAEVSVRIGRYVRSLATVMKETATQK